MVDLVLHRTQQRRNLAAIAGDDRGIVIAGRNPQTGAGDDHVNNLWAAIHLVNRPAYINRRLIRAGDGGINDCVAAHCRGAVHREADAGIGFDLISDIIG